MNRIVMIVIVILVMTIRMVKAVLVIIWWTRDGEANGTYTVVVVVGIAAAVPRVFSGSELIWECVSERGPDV